MTRIVIRHKESGLEVRLEDKQAIADHIAANGHQPDDWEGHQCLGPLPEPTPAEESTAEVETKTYADGTEATGTAPLPDQSPAEQEAAPTGLIAKAKAAVKKATAKKAAKK